MAQQPEGHLALDHRSGAGLSHQRNPVLNVLLAL